MRFRYSKFGLAVDPRGAHVTLPWQGRVLIGEVVGAYRSETRGMTHLKVRHFNGEQWPIDPVASAVEVLERIQED